VALADAIKGISMFRSTKINVPSSIGRNMSWFTPEELPGNKYYIFGKRAAGNWLKKWMSSTRADSSCSEYL